jgi:hypothetical protein
MTIPLVAMRIPAKVLLLSLAAVSSLAAQQVADSAFAPAIAHPAFAPGQGPVVRLDEGHHDFHTLNGRYLTFGRLLRRDGYVVLPAPGRFTRQLLDSTRVLVIANALNEVNAGDNWKLPTPSAFEPDEIAAVRDWVQDGGSLLLIADHMPFGGAATDLAAAFGIGFSNGFAFDPRGGGLAVFRRTDGTLAASPITDGRDPSERVDSVVAFTGQAFRLIGPGTPLMTFPAGWSLLLPVEAWQFSDLTQRLSAEGLLQGAVTRYGRGRVAAFGEAAMFSAQLAGPQRRPMGMNAPAAAQNPQFLLNVLHWLTGILDQKP